MRAGTGEEVREVMHSGGGEENLRARRGDLSLACSPLRLFWLVAKNSSKLLRGEEGRKGGGKSVVRRGHGEAIRATIAY